ncbi:MAG: M24 family metallopeptidase, partial [Acidobacteriota bacterium]
RLTRTFMPHGVGHQLGLQVHDVGGHQSAPDGGQTSPPDDHVLRNTREMGPGHLLTAEPGLYFIPMLLDAVRSGEQSGHVNWSLVDTLIPCGGIRIEDDVLCTDDGFEDLTRDLIGPAVA